MKSLLTKLFAVIFIATLAVGCASSLTAPVQKVEKEKKEAVKQDDSNQFGDTARGENEVQPAKGRPDL